MRRFALLLIALAASVAFASPPPAAKVLTDAKAKAAREHKNIFVMFDASW